MAKLTKSLAQSIVPDNLKEIELFKVVVDVFIEYMEENSKLTLDSTKFLDLDNEVVFEELLKIYARNFYEVVLKARNNLELIRKLTKIHKNFNVDFDPSRLNLELSKLINPETLTLLKNFQQSKGTLRAIEYVFDIFNKIQFEEEILQSDAVFEVKETGNLLEYSVETNMLKDIYETFIKPLTHPVGWKYVYARLIQLSFKEYFFVDEVYKINILQVYNSNGLTDDFKLNRGFLFQNTENGTAILENGSPKTYTAQNKNVLNVTRFGKKYNILSLDSEINLVQDPTVKSITTKDDTKTDNTTVSIEFASGEILEQTSNPRTLTLYYGTGPNDLNKKIKKDYTPFISEYSLYLNYTTELKFRVKDTIGFEAQTGFSDTTGTRLHCGCGNAYVGTPLVVGQTRINETDYTNEVTLNNLNLKVGEYKQCFLGVKFNKPRMLVYLDLAQFSQSDYPLTISLNGDEFKIDYIEGLQQRIIKFNNIVIHEKDVLEYGYILNSFELSITSNNEVIESISFNLIPRLKYLVDEIQKSDFNFEVSEDGLNYTRDGETIDFSVLPENPNYPQDITELENIQLVWDYIEYQYYAQIGELSQSTGDKDYLKSIELLSYKPPRHYSNIVGNFKVGGSGFAYSPKDSKFVLVTHNGAICSDSFSIETYKDWHYSSAGTRLFVNCGNAYVGNGETCGASHVADKHYLEEPPAAGEQGWPIADSFSIESV